MSEKPTYEELEQRVLKLEKEAIVLTQTEKDLDIFFESSTDLLCFIGFDRKFKRVNSSWHKTLGWYEEELLGRLYTEFVYPEDIEIAISVGKKSKERGEHVSGFENRYRCKDGSYRWLSWSAMPVPERQLTFAIARDITDSKRSEEALKESEEKYRILVETIPHGISENDLQGTLTYANSANHRILGYESGELIGMSTHDLQPSPSDRQAMQDFIDTLVREQPPPTPVITKNLKKDGKIIDVQLDWDYKRDKNGNINGFVLIVTDITDRKKAEAARGESEKRWRSLAQNIPPFVVETDIEGNVIFLNKVQPGFSLDDFVGKSIFKVTSPESIVGFKSTFPIVVENGEEAEFVALGDGPYKKKAWYHHHLVPLKDDMAQVASVIMLVTDITNQRLSEEALRESEQDLRIRNRIAEIFLTTSDDEMYGEVLKVVLDAMESPYGTFAYINEDGDRIVPSMTRDIWDECKMPDKGIFFPRDT